jgi:hypothetical protein
VVLEHTNWKKLELPSRNLWYVDVPYQQSGSASKTAVETTDKGTAELRDEVTEEWRRLLNKELCALYSSSIIIRVIKSRKLRWAGHVARMGEWRGAYRTLVGKPEGRRPLG